MTKPKSNQQEEQSTKPANHYVDNKKFLAELTEYRKKVVEARIANTEIPPINNYIGDCFLKIANHLSYKSNFINYCVDEKTEALTDSGWKGWNEITTNDKILSSDGGVFKWSTIKSIYKNEHYDGMMFHLTNKNVLDAFVTPNHKFLTERGLISVNLLKSQDHIILMADALQSSSEIHDDNFVQLVGWCITEGHLIRRKRVKNLSLAQKEGANADKIKNTLVALNAKFKEYYYPEKRNIVTWFMKSSDIVDKIHDAIPDKVLTTKFILELSTRQRQLLIETMVAGDGWLRRSGGMSYCQKDENHVKQFQYLATLAGYTVTTKKVNIVSFNEPTFIFIMNLFKKKRCKVETTDFHGGFNSNHGGKNVKKEDNENIPTIPYKGVVWCPETEYGNFVCRRNDTIFITGNSFKDEMISDAVENCLTCVANFDPEISTNPFAYFTQVSYFAFIRRIQKEQKQTKVKQNIIENIDIDQILYQEGEQSEVSNQFLEYLRKQLDYTEIDKKIMIREQNRYDE